jgi:hypothetical protein
MDSYHLYSQDRDLGEVHHLSADFPHAWAHFSPSPGLEATILDLFSFLVDEDRSPEDPPFQTELLDEGNWYVVDTRGRRGGITVPAVYLDEGTIAWRFRGDRPDWTPE